MIGIRAKETTTTTGTGNVSLLGAATASQSLYSVFGTSQYFQYEIAGGLETEYEYGFGRLTDSATMVRERVYVSSNANALVDFTAGTKTVRSAPFAMVPGLPPVIPSVGSSTKLIELWGNGTISSTAASLSTSFVWYERFYWPGGPKISGIATYVASGGSSTVDVGIYALDESAEPAARIAYTASSISTGSAGLQSQSFAAAIRLPPGWYAIGSHSNGGTSQFATLGGANNTHLWRAGFLDGGLRIVESGSSLPASATPISPPTTTVGVSRPTFYLVAA